MGKPQKVRNGRPCLCIQVGTSIPFEINDDIVDKPQKEKIKHKVCLKSSAINNCLHIFSHQQCVGSLFILLSTFENLSFRKPYNS